MRLRIINYSVARRDVHCSIVTDKQLYVDEVFQIPVEWLLKYMSAWRCRSA